jgi:hypothetical protein
MLCGGGCLLLYWLLAKPALAVGQACTVTALQGQQHAMHAHLGVPSSCGLGVPPVPTVPVALLQVDVLRGVTLQLPATDSTDASICIAGE